MKYTPAIATLLLILPACNQQQPTNNPNDNLAAQVQELKSKYKPGLGEYMMGIQLHHSKLWFAGQNNNWPLADYELGEIKESFQSIKDVETDRPEVKTIDMIQPALDSLSNAIAHKSDTEFKKDYVILTNTCNNCHLANNFGFNVITTPTALPVTNQDFKPRKN